LEGSTPQITKKSGPALGPDSILKKHRLAGWVMEDKMEEPLIQDLGGCSALELFEVVRSEPFCFFLDSGITDPRLGRYSFLGWDPFLILKSKGEFTQVQTPTAVKCIRADPLVTFNQFLKQYLRPFPESLPFTGAAVGYLAYDLCRVIERIPQKAVDDLALPDLFLAFYDTALVMDHYAQKGYLVSSGLPARGEEQKKRARARLNEFERKITALPGKEKRGKTPHSSQKLESNFTREDYLAAVRRAKEYIAAGDIYQVNLSQRFGANLTDPPYQLYRKLRDINPAPFAAYLDFHEPTIISASPERFLKVSNGQVETRPIKGTRPRGFTPDEDQRLAHALRQSPKDLAEHLMIVDLERNDLGRVCEYGSVLVSEFVALETYATVFHLVSTIEGRLRPEIDHLDLLRATFPGGSITGAPKIRSMEIIDELEPTQRSVYTGSIGYFSFNGNIDLNIAIRTLILKNDQAYFQVGGGIVADSDPMAEYEETLDKGRALTMALEIGEKCPI